MDGRLKMTDRLLTVFSDPESIHITVSEGSMDIRLIFTDLRTQVQRVQKGAVGFCGSFSV